MSKSVIAWKDKQGIIHLEQAEGEYNELCKKAKQRFLDLRAQGVVILKAECRP